MTSKLIPQHPDQVMVLRKVTPDILTCSVPFLRFGRVEIGGRGTLVRLQNGSVAVFPPVALTEATRSAVREMGEVKYITALDNEHHIFLDDWHKEYPQAKLIGPDALGPKREKMNKALPFSNLFKANKPMSIDAEFDREFEYEYVYAHANKELVFYHKPTKTLIEADLMFNLPATEQTSRSPAGTVPNFITKIMCGINNTQGSAIWQKRFIWYLISAQDRSAYNKSVARIDKWDFSRIIPCHGDVIEGDGKGIFRKVFEWHLAAAKKTQ